MSAITSGPATPAPLLVFACGNPSRGDDALGPALLDLLEQHCLQQNRQARFELLTDFQLQVEHAVDLEQREAVLFVDADVSASAPFEFFELQPLRDDSYTTHAMSPAAVLAVYQQIYHRQPPPCYMLSIRGYEFELGGIISDAACLNLQQGFEFTRDLLETNVANWHGLNS